LNGLATGLLGAAPYEKAPLSRMYYD